MLEEELEASAKLQSQVAELINKMSKFERERVISLYKCGIITCWEARHALGLPDVNPIKIDLTPSQVRTAKRLRNRYDYLCRKMKENKPFSERDEEDYAALKQVFSNSDV